MSQPPRSRVEVLLLTEDDCAFCDQARDVLHRLSSEYPLSITTQDLGSPAGRDLVESAGMLFAPGLFLDGEPFAYGRLSERKLRRELERRLATPKEAHAG